MFPLYFTGKWMITSLRLSKSIIFNRNCSLVHQVHKTVSRFYYQQIRFPVHRKRFPWQNQDEVSDDFVNLLSGMGSQKTDLVLSFLHSCHCGLGINSPCFIYHQNFLSTAKTERHVFPLSNVLSHVSISLSILFHPASLNPSIWFLNRRETSFRSSICTW